MPGVPKMDLPRRPLIVHSGDYATTYDMMDNFYMLWQRKSSVFTGEFACCRLGHMRKDSRSGEMLPVTCDKTRIRPLVRSLWERKVYHLSTMPPVVRWMFHWRWASHADMLMSDFVEDTQQSCDPNVKTLDDMTKKYIINEEHYGTFHAIMPMFGGMFGSHPSMSVPDETEITGGGGSKIKPMLDAWFEKWLSLPLREYQVAWSVCYAVAEGNLEMLKHLHVHEKADLSLGYCWGITLLDFAAGKGHTASSTTSSSTTRTPSTSRPSVSASRRSTARARPATTTSSTSWLPRAPLSTRCVSTCSAGARCRDTGPHKRSEAVGRAQRGCYLSRRCR